MTFRVAKFHLQCQDSKNFEKTPHTLISIWKKSTKNISKSIFHNLASLPFSHISFETFESVFRFLVAHKLVHY